MNAFLPALLLTLLPAALLPTVQAASSGTTAPLSVTSVSSCVIGAASASPVITLSPAYLPGNVAPGSQGQVSVSVICNKDTPVTQRTLTGNDSSSAPGAHVTSALRQTSPGNADTLNVETWFTVGATTTVTSGVYSGGQQTDTVLNAGWPATPQFGASAGSYSGSVSLTVVF